MSDVHNGKSRNLKSELLRLIYFGVFENGATLPTERVLAKAYNMSRETVRRTLSSLKEEGIIESKQGAGTVVKLQMHAYANDLDTIVLVAPADRHYFSDFLKYFQNVAENNGTKVLFYHYTGNYVEDVLFDLLQQGIHNVVIWASAYRLHENLMYCLRCLGLNCVLFDGSEKISYGDAVFIDNDDGVEKAYNYAAKKYPGGKIGYIGWDDMGLPSALRREQRFRELDHGRRIWHFPWRKNTAVDNFAESFMNFLELSNVNLSSLICSDADIGLAVYKAFARYNVDDVEVVVVDDMEVFEELKITGYAHRFNELAKQTYECLYAQSRAPESWVPEAFPIKGELIVRR